MPIDFNKRNKPTPKSKASKQVFDWRPPIGTRVLIKKHSAHGGKAGTVVKYGKWMGLKTLEVEIDGMQGQRAGITDPEQIMVIVNE